MRKKAHIETARKKGNRQTKREGKRPRETQTSTQYLKEIMQMAVAKLNASNLFTSKSKTKSNSNTYAIQRLRNKMPRFTYVFTCIMEMGNWA